MLPFINIRSYEPERRLVLPLAHPWHTEGNRAQSPNVGRRVLSFQKDSECRQCIVDFSAQEWGEAVFFSSGNEGVPSLAIRRGPQLAQVPFSVFAVAVHPGARFSAMTEALRNSFEQLAKPTQWDEVVGELKSYQEVGLLECYCSSTPHARFPQEPRALRARGLRLLGQHHIPIDRWGVGEAKSLSLFLKELEIGDSKLLEESGDLIRSIEVARVNVFYKSEDGTVLNLYEAGQFFSDGRTRIRSNKFSVGEKVQHESTREAALRGLRDELGIKTPVTLQGGELTATDADCQDYPGLRTRKVFVNYSVWLNEDQYKEEGYTENQDDKRTEFRWRVYEPA